MVFFLAVFFLAAFFLAFFLVFFLAVFFFFLPFLASRSRFARILWAASEEETVAGSISFARVALVSPSVA